MYMTYIHLYMYYMYVNIIRSTHHLTAGLAIDIMMLQRRARLVAAHAPSFACTVTPKCRARAHTHVPASYLHVVVRP